MVTQEGAPSLGEQAGSLDHILRDTRLGDLKAEFEQLAMNWCFAGSHSPRPPHLAPPTPQPVAWLCSSASQLLLRSLTSHVRSSSATAPRLPDAGQSGAPHRHGVLQNVGLG